MYNLHSLFYNLLLLLLSPLIWVFLWVRRARGKESSKTWRERWGHVPMFPKCDGSSTIWVHAVSVGEVMAAVPVLRELRAKFPAATLVLSTTTVGGREVADKQVGVLADAVVAFPLDFPHVVRRALNTVRPDAIVLMEWEIWPNYLFAARCPVVVLNGRISDKGLRRGSGSRWLLRTVLTRVAWFAMQSEEDARRAVLVGAPAERMMVLGNTKFDEATQPVSDDERIRLCANLGFPLDNAPILVCGSTRPGEEAILADAIAKLLRTTVPNLRVVVAPRHLDRKEVAGDPFVSEPEFAPLLWRSEQRTSQTANSPTPRVLMLDTFGELANVYAVADIAFVGGSLLPFGGQSVFQPLAQGVPTLFGPHMNNQRDIAMLAQAAGVGFVVRDAEEFAREVTRILTLPADERDKLRAAARELIAQNQGVARRGVELVAQLMDTGGGAAL